MEWVPSAFWQLFWTWIYGPYELYRIRHIRDAHRWRLQTILCIVSGYVLQKFVSSSSTLTALQVARVTLVDSLRLLEGFQACQPLVRTSDVACAWNHRHAVRYRVLPHLRNL